MPPRVPLVSALIAAILGLPCLACQAGEDVGSLVRCLWLVQRFGTAEAVPPENDEHMKGQLARAIGKQGELTARGVQGLIDSPTFTRLAGGDAVLDSGEIARLLETETPAERRLLNSAVRAHAEWLSTSFDQIDAAHRVAGARLVQWIAERYRPGQRLEITAICTGNSRRSILAATLGNVAAAYHGLPEVHFASGGTTPSAFNSRTIATLKEIGVAVEPAGTEATRGGSGALNPVYTVRWGQGLETREFSKLYHDPGNPQRGFAALMVCGEADASCPLVKGADVRIAMPYLDPKIYDGSTFESRKYAEARDDIGRLMLCVMMQARNQLIRPAH